MPITKAVSLHEVLEDWRMPLRQTDGLRSAPTSRVPPELVNLYYITLSNIGTQKKINLFWLFGNVSDKVVFDIVVIALNVK